MKRFLPSVLMLSFILMGIQYQPLQAQVVMKNNETGTILEITKENPLLSENGHPLVWLTTERQGGKSTINITCNSTIDGMTFYRDNPGDVFALHYSDEYGVFSWEWRNIYGTILDEDPTETHTTDGSFTGTVFYGQSSTNVAWTYAIDIYLEDPIIIGTEYDAYFLITDPTAGGGIDDAEVSVDGFGSQTTNSTGYATFLDLPNGTYNYTVNASGYDLREGIFTINNEDAGITVDLSVEPTYQAAIFVYEDGNSEPISGASITVTGSGSQLTSATGQAAFSDLPNATYDFTVTATGYETYSGQFFISNADETIYVNLIPEPSLFNANFTITDSDTGLAVENATINLDGTGTETSDAAGQATFVDLADGTYSFTVTSDGYDVYTGDFTINGANEDVNVILTPSGVGIDDNNLSNVQLSPNPAHAQIQVHTNPFARGLVLTIFDASGKTLQSFPIESGTSHIDISEFDKGLYLYSVTSKTSGNFTGKFVKN
ncbi:MAG: carboxypeptidase regulatory-like domain-containing protein [Bacteroidota bacterium]